MSIQVEVKPEDVNEALVRAITDSAIGARLRAQIADAVRSVTSDGMLGRGIVRQTVDELIAKYVRDELAAREEQLREQVRAHLTDELVRDVTSAAIQAWVEKLRH